MTHVQDDWRLWSFAKPLEALRKWTDTNPIVETSENVAARNVHHCQVIACFTHKINISVTACIAKAQSTNRKAFVANKKLYFNCAAGQHSASQCPSKLSCRLCHRRHHTSLATNIIGSSVIHPVVIVDVYGHKFRALLDSGASHSYVSSTLIDLTRARTVKSGTRSVATLLGVTTTKPLEYDLCLRPIKRDFELNTRITQINKGELLKLDNPCYADRIEGYSRSFVWRPVR